MHHSKANFTPSIHSPLYPSILLCIIYDGTNSLPNWKEYKNPTHTLCSWSLIVYTCRCVEVTKSSPSLADDPSQAPSSAAHLTALTYFGVRHSLRYIWITARINKHTHTESCTAITYLIRLNKHSNTSSISRKSSRLSCRIARWLTSRVDGRVTQPKREQTGKRILIVLIWRVSCYIPVTTH